MTAIALIAGLATGAAISVLFAPRSGRKTREQLLNSATELTDQLTLLFKAEKATAEQEEGDHTIEDVREQTRAHADQLLGPEKKRKNPQVIKVASAGTTAWKDN